MKNHIKQKRNDIDGWFDAVVTNGILFLDSSVSNLSTSPKSSLIDLYTAIELFFKARLMKEHWSLIISKPESAIKQKFESGDFHSVYLDQANNRLKNICGENIKQEAIDNFKALGNHRNQIVHFAHTEFSGKETKIIIEHWVSWFHLHELLTNNWADIFASYQVSIDKIDAKVKLNHEFLKAKFDLIQAKIEIEKKKGSCIVCCPSCRLESAKVLKSHGWGEDVECLVCDVKDLKLKKITTSIPCSNCNEGVEYFVVKDHKCISCHTELTSEYALEKYTEIYKNQDPEARYNDGVDPLAYCHDCQSEEPTVLSLEGMWVCVRCEDRGWTALDCEHCDSFVTGDVQAIQYLACHRCEDDVRKFHEKQMAEYRDEIEIIPKNLIPN